MLILLFEQQVSPKYTFTQVTLADADSAQYYTRTVAAVICYVFFVYFLFEEVRVRCCFTHPVLYTVCSMLFYPSCTVDAVLSWYFYIN